MSIEVYSNYVIDRCQKLHFASKQIERSIRKVQANKDIGYPSDVFVSYEDLEGKTRMYPVNEHVIFPLKMRVQKSLMDDLTEAGYEELGKEIVENNKR